MAQHPAYPPAPSAYPPGQPADMEALRMEYELKILAVRAEEKAKYDAQLDAVRTALEKMYNEKLDAELRRRQAQAAAGPVTDATRATDLIERLFGDRPSDKKNMWIAVFEDNEITNVGIMRKLNAAAWQRLNLPIGVEQALQDAIKGASAPTPAGPAPTPNYAAAAPGYPAPTPTAGGTRVITPPGQNAVYIDDGAGTARTMSGCPYKTCEKDFEFIYHANGKHFLPKDCPSCKRSVKPPPRLTDAAKTVYPPAPIAVAPVAPVVVATQPVYAAQPAPAAAPPPAYVVAPMPISVAPVPPPPATAPPVPPASTTAASPAAQLRVVETPGQNAVMVDDVNRVATTMSGCPYKGCEKDFEFRYDGATKLYSPAKCPVCGKNVKAPGRLVSVATKFP